MGEKTTALLLLLTTDAVRTSGIVGQRTSNAYSIGADAVYGTHNCHGNAPMRICFGGKGILGIITLGGRRAIPCFTHVGGFLLPLCGGLGMSGTGGLARHASVSKYANTAFDAGTMRGGVRATVKCCRGGGWGGAAFWSYNERDGALPRFCIFAIYVGFI